MAKKEKMDNYPPLPTSDSPATQGCEGKWREGEEEEEVRVGKRTPK